MKPEWTGNLIGHMHNSHVTAAELATQLGVTKAYVSMVLNGVRTPSDAQEKFQKAYEAILTGQRK